LPAKRLGKVTCRCKKDFERTIVKKRASKKRRRDQGKGRKSDGAFKGVFGRPLNLYPWGKGSDTRGQGAGAWHFQIAWVRLGERERADVKRRDTRSKLKKRKGRVTFFSEWGQRTKKLSERGMSRGKGI